MAWPERPVVAVGARREREIGQVAGPPELLEAVRDRPLAVDPSRSAQNPPVSATLLGH